MDDLEATSTRACSELIGTHARTADVTHPAAARTSAELFKFALNGLIASSVCHLREATFLDDDRPATSAGIRTFARSRRLIPTSCLGKSSRRTFLTIIEQGHEGWRPFFVVCSYRVYSVMRTKQCWSGSRSTNVPRPSKWQMQVQ